MLANKGDDLAIALGSRSVLASGLEYHAEAGPAVMHLGEAVEEISGGALGFVELAGTNEECEPGAAATTATS